jgi:adenine-specific DNA methylase
MSQEVGQSEDSEKRVLPIEKGFPIEQMNDMAEKESYGGARQWYRPVYTMHKWWARRNGSVFRTISLYTLLQDSDKVEVLSPGENGSITDLTITADNIQKLIDGVSHSEPDTLWELYPKDVRVEDMKILDPFMGGGTSLVEASRFGAEVTGYDLNPVAWFVTKKEIEAGSVDVDLLHSAYSQIKDNVAERLKSYYKTPCPNASDHQADVMNSFWVKQVNCTSCGDTVPLFNDYRVGKVRGIDETKYNVYCPECEAVTVVDDWQSESECGECGHAFLPSQGGTSGGDYVCHSCGDQYSLTDAIQEQDGFDLKYYAVEYHCPTCDDRGLNKSKVKGYKKVEAEDKQLYKKAREEWEQAEDLREFVPDKPIRAGWKTDATQFEGSLPGNGNLPGHGYYKWTDMFNHRQLVCLSLLLKEISEIENQQAKEYLLLAFTDTLRYRCMMTTYKPTGNQLNHIFKTNSFDPPKEPVEGNLWGAEYGTGKFQSIWEMVIRGVEWCQKPTERYIEYPDKDGYPDRIVNRSINEPQTVETEPFNQPVGENAEVKLGDARGISAEDEYDIVLTDPPYYHNVFYSELSDFFYVWQKIILEEEYDGFQSEHTERAKSIVANPAEGKGDEEFESELMESFDAVRSALNDDGVLAFTYHHSDSDSWGELLTALCEVGFEVTATYPVSADISTFGSGEDVEFDIIIVARPGDDREPISWNSLRRNIYRTAQKTRQRLEENRNLSRGDIGVVEMGRCFHEYSKHHGKVKRAGETMTAKEVVDEIYGVIQHGSDIGEIDVFLDLLETPDASYDDLNKLTRGTNATPDRMEDMRLYRMDDGFTLGTWDDEKRIAYIQSRVDSDEELTDLDRAQFLRYRWEHGKSVSEYLSEWEITDDLHELCEGLADATGDDTYRNILESRLSDY